MLYTLGAHARAGTVIGLAISSVACATPGVRPAPFTHCSRAPDPPTCLIEQALRQDSPDPGQFLFAVLASGNGKLVTDHPELLIEGASAAVSTGRIFLSQLGIEVPVDAAETQVASTPAPTLLAAVALATAAQGSSDPFANFVAKSLAVEAGNDPAIAPLAAILWSHADTYGYFVSQPTRPQGRDAIWRAVIAAPPRSAESIAELASHAMFYQERMDAGLSLLSVLQSAEDVDADTKAHIASLYARHLRMADAAQGWMDRGGSLAPGYDVPGIQREIAEARLHRGYDAQAAGRVVGALVEKTRGNEEAFLSYLDPDGLIALEAARARAELAYLGNAYLQRAARGGDDADGLGQWYALASDSFRRAGNRQAAIQAARKGLPTVADAVAGRDALPGQQPRRARSNGEKLRQVVATSGNGAAPVRALYLAGERDEAVSFGYLRGQDRLQAAIALGERAGSVDVHAVVEDRDEHSIEMFARQLLEEGDRQTARRFYEALRLEAAASNEQLGFVAAVCGNAEAAQAHFAQVARDLERRDREDSSWYALVLAAKWARARVILARTAD